MAKEEHSVPLPPYHFMVHFLDTSPNSLCGSKGACPLCGYLCWHNLASLNFSTLPNLAEAGGPFVLGNQTKSNLLFKLVKGKTVFWVWTGKAELSESTSQLVCYWPLCNSICSSQFCCFFFNKEAL